VKVTVWPDRYVSGWNGDETDGLVAFPVMDIADALAETWHTDAHFVPYYVPGEDAIPRVNLGGWRALEELGSAPVFDGAVFDVDAPGHQRSPEWDAAQLKALDALPVEISDFAHYWTRGGYRLVYDFGEPVERGRFKRLWSQLSARLKSAGVVVDDLRDVTRCYRLPNVVRDGQRQPADVELDNFGPMDLVELFDGDTGGAGDDHDPSRPFKGADGVRTPLQLPKLIEENRNVTLIRLGGRLRNIGLEEPEILAALREVARLRAPDWTPERNELERLASNSAKFKTASLVEAVAPPVPTDADDLKFALGSEAEIAREVIEELQIGDVAPVYDRGKVRIYRPAVGTWDELHAAEIRAIVARWDGEWIGTGSYNPDGSPKARPLKVSSALSKGVVDLVEVYSDRRGFFDAARFGLTFANGFVTVEGGSARLESFDPDQRSTDALPYAFNGSARPLAFVDMLRACWAGEPDLADRIRLVREYIGACLLGMAPTYQKGLIFVGDGANGKSTIQEVIRALFDHGFVVAIPPQEMGQEYRRAMMAGARLNVVNELPEAEIMDSEAVKAVVSGDLITARFIREAPFTFRPRLGNLWAANALPGVRDMSRGFWRRWLVLTFDREFEPGEQDRGLAARIIADELPALASWAITGAADLEARGHYIEPTSSTAAVDEWRLSADIVARFVAEKTVETATCVSGARELYQVFSTWAMAGGHRPLSVVKFGKALTRLKIRKTRRSSGVKYAIRANLALADSKPGAEEGAA